MFSEFHIAHPFGKNQFATRVRIYNGIRRIDVSTDLVNEEEFVRYRVLFPTSDSQRDRYVRNSVWRDLRDRERQEFPPRTGSIIRACGKGVCID